MENPIGSCVRILDDIQSEFFFINLENLEKLLVYTVLILCYRLVDNRLNMELNLRSLFGLLCTAVLIG
jgi:hypothetical protein